MKRKIYYFILLFALIFAAGCNKNEEKANPTPTVAVTATATPTPSPTPLPENLAKTNLKKLPELFNNLMSYIPQNTVDYSNGIGYDITVELSLGQQITELLGLTGLDHISAIGTIDIKEAIAANISLYLNDSEVLNSHLFADSANLLYNLPKYSSNYAATTWEQLVNSLNEGESAGDIEGDSSITGSSHEVIRTISTVDRQTLPSNEELIKLLCSYLQDFEECFIEVDGITENASIGTGDYVLTGDKHTVSANINELYVLLESLETELLNYGEVELGIEDLKVEGATSFLLDYYINENGDYAWAAYPDNQAQEPLVYVSTSLGFCLYRAGEGGTTEIIMYSEKTSEKAGVITIPSSEASEGEEVAEGTINYEFGDNSFSAHAMFDTMVLTLETSKINDTILYNATIVVDGISIVLEETITPDRTDISCTLASYGMEYITISLTMATRDYIEIPIPQNTVDLDTWSTELDQEALMADVLQLMMDYPFLMELFGGLSDDTDEEGSEDNSWNKDFWGNNGPGTEDEPFELPEDYTDSFADLTGYSVDDTGYVDFSPLESEVLALGKPSTGLDSMEITEDQKQALFDYAKNSFDKCDTDTESFYWIWGSVEYNDVKSYYTKDYGFSDPNSWDNSITFEFDAVSGEFVSVSIYNEDKTTALRMANEILTLLGVDYTVTAEIAENYTFAHNFSFSGYDAAQYGDNYYNVSFSVYYPEW